MTTDLVGRWPAHVQRERMVARPAVEPVARESRPAEPAARDETLDFVRFCYRRRRVGWPELYDEMCAVAARGAFGGLGYAELAERGILLCLGELTLLSELTERVACEEQLLHDAALVDGRVPIMLVPSVVRG